MTPLYQKLVTLIESEGPISIERYMSLCLGDPEHGYYMTRDPFGVHGDFTTAPEMTQMFGELIGLWIADLYLKLGSPKSIAIAEIGPGRGTLMSDALRAMRAIPNLVESAHVYLVETSPVLIRMQQAQLSSSGVKIGWLNSIDELPDDLTIIVANEWLDALPVRQYQRVENGWAERLIGLDQERRLILGIDLMRVLPASDDIANGTVRERAVIGETLVSQIATRLQSYGGAFLAIDYGSAQSGFGDTLQAVKDHRFVPVFDEPGEADLTTQVDFAALLRVARKIGARTFGPIRQGDFLLSLGLKERASRLMQQADENQQKAIMAAFERLTNRDKTGMGTLFKVIALTAAQSPDPAGFI
jgi:NADH dehydrogenase [ubiquinone] 1 alpha subcomplex assembly factor 7